MQNYKNHARYIPLWHMITPLLHSALLGGSIINLVKAKSEVHYSAVLILGITILLLSFYWYSRAFALKAQDRVIRAEENFRYYLLTGKPLPAELRLSQIIALRFASDEEYLTLVQRAVSEKLSSRDIKQSIQNWKADHHRA